MVNVEITSNKRQQRYSVSDFPDIVDAKKTVYVYIDGRLVDKLWYDYDDKCWRCLSGGRVRGAVVGDDKDALNRLLWWIM
jgi:hypothetical protein